MAAQHESKAAILDAALSVIRSKGYAATRIEDICETAHLTKGSFFHHFKSKEDMAVAAAEHWSVVTGELFAAAAYREAADPLQRLLGYIDFRKALIKGELAEFTCLAGTVIQEVYDTHPKVRDAYEKSIGAHAAMLKTDIEQVMHRYPVSPPIDAESLALYTQAVIQGAFILAKARQDSRVAIDCLEQLYRYIKMLFVRKKPAQTRASRRRTNS